MIYNSFTFLCYNEHGGIYAAKKQRTERQTKGNRLMTQKENAMLERFFQYMTVVRGRSLHTVDSYRWDLTIFLSWVQMRRAGVKKPRYEEIEDLSISELDTREMAELTRSDILEFLVWTVTARENGGATRKRKLASLRSFFKYLVNIERAMESSPAAEIDPPTQPKRLPKYLTEEESIELLKAVLRDEDSRTRERDFCMMTLFLNCGMRLSELVGIDLNDLDPKLESLRVTGKGAKERVIYLNNACREALLWYFSKRDEQGQVKAEHRNALFLSRLNQRIGNRAVQNVVYKYLDLAGLGYKKCSAHKLRHTAATLMYRSGQVDIRVLKDILGHEELSTTQIYTHVSDESMQKAMTQSPLSGLSHADLTKE